MEKLWIVIQIEPTVQAWRFATSDGASTFYRGLATDPKFRGHVVKVNEP